MGSLGSRLTIRLAVPHAVHRAVVAALAEVRVDHAVAAVTRLLASRRAAVRARLVRTSAILASEIALFEFGVVHAVAAERAERAVRRAAVVQPVLVLTVAEVALLRGRDDAVAAAGLTDGTRGRESGQGELVVRFTRVPIGVEDDDLVGLADFEPEVRHVPHRDLIPGAGDQVLRLDHPLSAGVGELNAALQALVR